MSLKSSEPVIFSDEHFAALWPEVNALGREHFDEVNEDVLPQRSYNLDFSRMIDASLSGMLKIYTARRSTRLLGYLTWTLLPDVESHPLWLASQGAWFVSPSAPRRTAFDLFFFSLTSLRSLRRISYINCHHHFLGRGRNLERFFTRLGAKKMKVEYSLWLGGSS